MFSQVFRRFGACALQPKFSFSSLYCEFTSSAKPSGFYKGPPKLAFRLTGGISTSGTHYSSSSIATTFSYASSGSLSSSKGYLSFKIDRLRFIPPMLKLCSENSSSFPSNSPSSRLIRLRRRSRLSTLRAVSSRSRSRRTSARSSVTETHQRSSRAATRDSSSGSGADGVISQWRAAGMSSNGVPRISS